MLKTNQLNANLLEATENLIHNLLSSEHFLAYNQAQVGLTRDDEANALLKRLSALQSELRLKQTNGGITQTEVDELRAIQAQVQANSTIMKYAKTQQAAVNFLREINQEISQLLGLDFASLARSKTC